MKTNDIKSEYKIKLHNGWQGIMKDNKKGNIRLCEVQGIYTETGSIYAHDIKTVFNPINNQWENAEYTPAQLKLKTLINKF